MAIKLNQGADAALVTSATRAGLAATPGDYGKTFQSAADSYQKTMDATRKLWEDVGMIVGVIGKDMVENAQEFMSYKIKGGALNPDSAKFLVEELEANKKAQKDIGILGGILGGSETRQKKMELKLEQKELFAEIDAAAESINAGADAIANELYDHDLDLENGEMINAIIKSNLKDKTTAAGNTAVLSRDEKTGELMFSLLDSNGNPSTGSDGKPKTMTIKEFNKSIKTNIKDVNGTMGKTLNALNNGRATAGNKSIDGVYDEQMKQMDLNSIDAMLNTPTDLKRAMKTTFGYSNTSFYDDIKQPSTLSEDLYTTLLKATGNEGMLSADGTNTGVLENVKDLDGDGNISKAELQNAENYAVLSANILNLKDPEVSKAYFKEYTTDKLEKAFEYGYSKKAPEDGGGGDKTSKYGGWGRDSWNTKGTKDEKGAYVTWRDAESRRNDLDNFRDVGGVHGYYTWDDKKELYIRDDNEEFSMYQVADMEGLIKTGESAKNFNIATKVEQNLDQQRENTGLATSTTMKTGGDDAVSTALNKQFDLTDRRQRYLFVPYSRDLESEAGLSVYDPDISDNILTDDVTLVDPTNSYRPLIDPKTKKPYRFKTGEDFKQSDLDIINKIMEDAGYIKRKNINTEFED